MRDAIDDPKSWGEQDEAVNGLVSRRRLLRLMGYGTAGIVGARILVACGDSNPPGPADVTSAPAAARQIQPYFLGYSNVPIHSPSWENADAVRAAALMKPGTLRYPGGTVANYWDWRTGWFLPGALGSFLNAPLSIYRLRELQIAVHATGAIPIYVLNMLTSDLSTQMEMLRAARSMGLPVELVELGNEFYLAKPDDYVAKFPTGADYGKMATSWIRAIRAEFPGVQIAAVGGVPADPSGDPRKANWTNDLLQHLQGADALTWHPYVSLQQGTISPDSSSSVGEQLHALTSSRWQQFENGAQSLPADMKLWITEYNFVDASKQVFYRWIDGVYAVKMSLTFLEEARTQLACYYDMIGKTGNEVIFYDQQAQGSGGSTPAPFALTAAGWAMRLLGDALGGMTSAQRLSFSAGSPTAGRTTLPLLQGWVFSDGRHRQAVLVNSGPTSVSWAVDPAFAQGATFQQLAGDPFTRVTASDSLTARSGTPASQLALPAYSVTQLKQGAPA
jgi:hypothetical protein